MNHKKVRTFFVRTFCESVQGLLLNDPSFNQFQCSKWIITKNCQCLICPNRMKPKFFDQPLSGIALNFDRLISRNKLSGLQAATKFPIQFRISRKTLKGQNGSLYRHPFHVAKIADKKGRIPVKFICHILCAHQQSGEFGGIVLSPDINDGAIPPAESRPIRQYDQPRSRLCILHFLTERLKRRICHPEQFWAVSVPGHARMYITPIIDQNPLYLNLLILCQSVKDNSLRRTIHRPVTFVKLKRTKSVFPIFSFVFNDFHFFQQNIPPPRRRKNFGLWPRSAAFLLPVAIIMISISPPGKPGGFTDFHIP